MTKSLFCLAAVAALSAGMLVAETNYVIPWYVNPSPRTQVWLGDAAPDVTSLSIDPKGEYLLVGAVAKDGFNNVQAYKVEELIAATGIVTNGMTGKAVSPTTDVVAAGPQTFLGAAGDLSTATQFARGRVHWVGSKAPVAVSFGGADAVSSFAFTKDGSALWSNSTVEGRKEFVVEWLSANGTFTKGREIDTGLSIVRGVGVYTIKDVEYVVVGEGDATAATAGEIRLVKIADGSVSTLVADADHLSAGIVAVKMSHTDFFRPRFYALLSTGDVACYFHKPELSPTATTWSKTVSNADLLTAAKAPWSAENAQVTGFEVVPDGGTAVVAYQRRAGDETEASGPICLGLVKHTPRKWVIYEINDAGNPRQGSKRTLSDGVWQLNYTWGNSGEIWIGFNDGKTGSAWTSAEMHEYLDFSSGVAYKASDNSAHGISGNYQRALGTNDVSNWKAPRVLYHSSRMTDFSDKAKGWEGEGNYEEVIIDAPNLTSVSSWSGPSVDQHYIVYNLPKVGEAKTWAFYPNYGKYWGAYCRFEDQDFSSMKAIGYRPFMNWDATGVLSLPSATSFSNECCSACRYMTGAELGVKANTVSDLYGAAFRGCTSLKSVTIGGGPGFRFRASNVFESCPLEEVVFTGSVPTFNDNISVAWPDTAANTITFVVPRNSAAWEAILADSSKVKTRYTLAEQQAYRRANPGKYVPIGVLDKSVLRTKYDQLIAYEGMKGGCTLKLDRDDFFDDQVAVTSDWAPAPDGTYLHGTRVTLSVTPNATGTFRRWYGDVPAAQATNTTVTVTMTGNLWVYCRVVHPWKLAADKRTASNGNFTINCQVNNESQRTLHLGGWGWGTLYATADAGEGVCDLGGPVVLEGDSTPWTFTSWAGAQGFLCGTKHGKGAAHTLVTPGTMPTMTNAQFLHTNGRPDAASYKVFIFDEPNMTGTWSGWATCGQFDLTRMVLWLPSLGRFEGDGSLWQIPLSETKFDWWNLDGLTYLNGSSWASDWSNWAPASGTLTLPSLRSLHVNSNNRASLFLLHNVEEIVLGGRTKTDTVQSICNRAFESDVKLRTVTIYNDAAMTVGTGPLKGCTALQEIILQGPAIGETAFEALLSNVTAASTKPQKVYVSRLMPGWMATTYLDYAPTAEEKAEAPGESVFAVYRGGAEAPNGKALVIHRPGPYDRKSLYLILK